jgi:hypothetical protein
VQVLESCRALGAVSPDVAWETTKSPSPSVSLWIKHAKPARGERSTGLAKGETNLDCSAEEALAWWWAYCSRSRLQGSFEKGDKAKVRAPA